MEINPQDAKAGFDAVKAAVDTFKSIREMFRSDPAKYEAASVAVDNAEREVKFAEAQLAQALGYKLCRSHFPPKPMLLDPNISKKSTSVLIAVVKIRPRNIYLRSGKLTRCSTNTTAAWNKKVVG